MRTLGNNSGYSLIELMVSVGISSLTMLAVSYLMARQTTINKNADLNNQFDSLMSTLSIILRDEEGCAVNFVSPYAVPSYNLKDPVTQLVVQKFPVKSTSGRINLYAKKKSAGILSRGTQLLAATGDSALTVNGVIGKYGDLLIRLVEVQLTDVPSSALNFAPSNWTGDIFGNLVVSVQFGRKLQDVEFRRSLNIRFTIDRTGNVISCRA